MSTARTFAVSAGTVSAFAESSGDLNPLHVSVDYARLTPFGRPVVHGVLGLALALGQSGLDAFAIASLSTRFLSPMYTDISYVVDVTADDRSGARLIVRDGSRRILDARIQMAGVTDISGEDGTPTYPFDTPRDVLGKGNSRSAERVIVVGAYWPDVPRLRSVLPGLPDWLLVALGALSFTVGMAVPGRRALLRSVNVARPAALGAPLDISVARPSQASLARGIARIEVTASSTAGTWPLSAAATIRPVPPVAVRPERDQVLLGRSALVVGASRGLGAAMLRELVARGCRTWALQRTAPQDSVDSLEIAVVGDATDPGQVRALSHSLMMETNGLDLLIVSATGTLDSLWLDAEHEKRIWSYLEHELRLLLVPLTHLASAMRQGGLCAFVSSEALGLAEGGGLGPECSEWPHYVAAKAAGEALMRVAALEYPWLTFVVARLPALDTQLTPRTAIAPGESADLIAGELIDAWSRGYPSRFDIAWLGSDQELP